LALFAGGVCAAIAARVVYLWSPPAGAPAPAAIGLARATHPPQRAPRGAAISTGGEPTGLTTPATISGITATTVEVSLELSGHAPRVETIAVPAHGAITEHFAFAGALPSRLVIAGLPHDATILVDGEVHDAGTVVPMSPGTHEVRVVVGGRTVATTSVEASAGDQVWKLAGQRLERVATP
jgi:hypothetical protein